MNSWYRFFSNYFQKARPHGTNSPGTIDGDHPQNQDESVFNLYLKNQNKNYSLKSQIVKTNHNVKNLRVSSVLHCNEYSLA